MKRKKIFFLVFAVLFLFWGGWGSLYGFAYHLVKFLPGQDSFLPTSTPLISAKWQYTPGVKLTKARVLLNGEDISSKVSLSSKGFIYTPLTTLKEGRHTIKTILNYRFLFTRQIRREWNFTTDTVPPKTSLDGSTNGIVGTSKHKFSLSGQTEPRALLKVTFRYRVIREVKVSSQGHFVLSLKSLSQRNELKLVAVDRAGNRYRKVFSVVYDAVSPEIVSLSPAPNSTIRTTDPQVTVKLNEPDSVIRSVNLKIDGKPVATTYQTETQTLLFNPRFFFDGSHKAYLDAEDAAGNKTSREWIFTVDTSRIEINLSQRRLYLQKGGKLISTYPVAVGLPEFPTPQGHWRIIRKRKNPTWINPGSDWAQTMPDSIPPGPDNPLGQRALDLSTPGIRIHGTPSVNSVGRAASHGCIRMYPWNIEVLFNQVSVGTPVDITP